MRRAVVPSLMLLCTALTPPTVRAQVAPDSACTYSRCALRVDYGWFSTRLVRGTTGEPVARLGWFGSGVDVLLTASDSAAYYAREYQTRRQTDALLGLLAGALLIAGFADGEDMDEGGPLILAGLTLSLVSLPFTVGIRRSLDRSVWWYNRDLSRP